MTLRNISIVASTSIAFLLLGACGSSPPVRYFTLESSSVEYAGDDDQPLIMALGPLRMPEYINRSQMVSRGADSEILVDDLNRWAEPLDQMIHRALASEVDAQLEDVVVLAYPTSSMVDTDVRLVGRILRFDTDSRGEAVLEVQWGAATGGGEPLVTPRRDKYTSRVDDMSNPGAKARALSDVLDSFGRQIAEELMVDLGSVTDGDGR